MKRSILIVEDDPRLGEMLQEYLTAAGFEASLESRGDRAVHRIHEEAPNLVVLDLMLPGLDGLEVCQRVRRDYRGPILMLTARRGDLDQVVGLESGADDYVLKPCQPRVLLARIRALLRRQTAGTNGLAPSLQRAIVVDRLKVDRSTRQVRVGDSVVGVTSAEFDLAWLLARHVGEIVSRDVLYQEIRGIPYDGLDRGMDIHVSRLRQKLKRAGLETPVIVSVRGEGYQLTLPGQP